MYLDAIPAISGQVQWLMPSASAIYGHPAPPNSTPTTLLPHQLQPQQQPSEAILDRLGPVRPSKASMCKVAITIPSLVLLRRAMRRWRSSAAAAGKLEGEKAVPAGHVAVRVEGGDGSPRRFVVRLAHLNHPAFRELLQQAEEEYGFPAASGPIALPCDEDHFLDVLHRVSSNKVVSSCCCGPAAVRRGGGDSRPLLQGMAVEKLVW